jgi:tetratricopeptide (TPR) repeat protein
VDLTGRRIRNYAVLSPLGAGGMGQVYLALDETLGRKVAIKVLLAGEIGDEDAHRRFLREARAAATLDHPNICPVHEVGEFEGRTYVVLQHVEGETLRSRLGRGALPEREALTMAAQVASALAEAHRHGIVHRDVKPENIMVTPRGQVKVLDFGLAKVAVASAPGDDTATALSRPGVVMGTVPYMSPEQVRGEDVDARSDVFSFGAVLFEMLSGRRLFDARTSAEVIAQILTRDPPPLQVGRPDGPLDRMLQRALAKDASRRYCSMEALLADLRQVGLQETEAVRAPRASARPRFALGALAAACAAAVLGLVFVGVKRRAPAPAAATHDPAAYDAFVRAKVNVSDENSASNDKAIALLQNALALEPAFAAAHAELARAYNVKSFYFASAEQRARLDEDSAVEVEKALALDPNLAEAHLARGNILWTHENRFPHEQAIEAFRRAIELDPRLDDAHHQLAVVYFHIGLLDKAWGEIDRTLALNPSNALARFRYGVIDMYRGRYDEAIGVFEGTPLKKNPSLQGFQTATALFRLGRDGEASAVLDAYLARYPADPAGVGTSTRAMMLARAGKRAEAEAAIGRALSIGQGFGHFHHTAYNVASARALLGQRDEALKWLQVAVDDGFPCYPLFAQDTQLDTLRQDPRFVAFLAKLELQWERRSKL